MCDGEEPGGCGCNGGWKVVEGTKGRRILSLVIMCRALGAKDSSSVVSWMDTARHLAVAGYEVTFH